MRKIQDLFPTTIGFSQLDTNLCLQAGQEVLKLIDPKTIASEGGATTLDNLNQLSQFGNLTSLIDAEVTAFATEVLGIEENSLEMSCMWSNVYKFGQLHGKHMHPNAFLSGVIYFNIPQDGTPGAIEFFDPRPVKNMCQPNYTRVTPMSVMTQAYNPEVGMMILFPSWLEHRVNKFTTSTDDVRISASFNYNLVRSSGPTMKINKFGV